MSTPRLHMAAQYAWHRAIGSCGTPAETHGISNPTGKGHPSRNAHLQEMRKTRLYNEAKMKILLIEDSKFQRIASERALVKAGYGVIHAGDGEEGLRVARKDIPDLIL